METSAVG